MDVPAFAAAVSARRLFLVAAALVAAIAAGSTGTAVGGGPNRAGLVVRHDDGRVERTCVAFDEQTISGMELLERSGLDVVAERSALGAAICSLDGEGCRHPDQDCFCRFPTFWGYWVQEQDDARWRFSETGSQDRDVEDGSLHGWSFGRDGKPAPPSTSFDEVCTGGETAAPRAPARAAADAGERPASSRPSYAPFAAFAGALMLLAAVLVLRRRRGRSSG